VADVEQTLPLQIVIDASYTGAKGTRLDTITASGLFNQSGFASLFFDYQGSTAFSNFNALTVTTTKRLQNGLALSVSFIHLPSVKAKSSMFTPPLRLTSSRNEWKRSPGSARGVAGVPYLASLPRGSLLPIP
jgi:hypothetical protein